MESTKEPVTPTQTAQPKTFSLYGPQITWLLNEATRKGKKEGKPYNPSKVVQDLIDEKRKKEGKQ